MSVLPGSVIGSARRWLLGVALAIACPLFGVSQKYQDVVKARIDGAYAVILHSNGAKGVVPLADLNLEDQQWLAKISNASPLPRGKSEVRFVKAVVPVKNTIAVSKTAGPVETVQLNPPNVFRDQIEATCMLYARVHWLDIAGYYVGNVDIYKIINNANPNEPWADRNYLEATYAFPDRFKPGIQIHDLPPQADPFEWTRGELRKGRPVLGAFPKEVWQDLPPGFIAAHPWSGGSVGHQIVINGFTWNRDTRQGTFHIVNSWKELPEFDLKTDAAKGALIIQQSLSPKGEERPQSAKILVTKVTLLSSVGKTQLFEIQTNVGTRRVAAPDEMAARAMVENED